MDILKAKTDFSGNWDTTLDLAQNKFINLLKLQKGQIKFLNTYGFNTFAWLKNGIEYSAVGFIQYLKDEASKYNLYVKNILFTIEKDGGLKLNVTLTREKDNITFDYYLQNGI